MISEEIRRELRDVGLDVDEQTARFMDDEDMFIKYFHKFFESADGVVDQLRTAAAAGDLGEVERTAHALKGLAGNIGLGGVFGPAQKIVSDLRAGKTDSYQVDFQQLFYSYAAALTVSRKL